MCALFHIWYTFICTYSDVNFMHFHDSPINLNVKQLMLDVHFVSCIIYCYVQNISDLAYFEGCIFQSSFHTCHISMVYALSLISFFALDVLVEVGVGVCWSPSCCDN